MIRGYADRQMTAHSMRVDVDTFARCRRCRATVHADRCSVPDGSSALEGSDGVYVTAQIDGRGCGACGHGEATLRVSVDVK